MTAQAIIIRALVALVAIPFHEAGHAILFHVLPDVGPVYSVSIIPTGAGAAGYRRSGHRQRYHLDRL